MPPDALKDVLKRALKWPAKAQEELAEAALEIEARQSGEYEADPDELRAIDEALEAVRRGEIATEEEVDAVFAKYRKA